MNAETTVWMNGQLGDNASCYTQGFIDGQANAVENLDITYTYHYHEGDDTNEGGCYEKSDFF